MSSFGDAAYRLLLRAFPASFRRRHGEQMSAQFRHQRQGLRGRPIALGTLWARAAADAAWHGLQLRRADAPPGASRLVWLQDWRYALRGFRRDRALTAVIIAILTVGIAANAVMFGVVDRLLLQPPAGVEQADTLRRLHFGWEGPATPGRRTADRHSYVFVSAIRDRVTAFSAAAATSLAEVTLGAGPDARLATAQLVDAAYFPLLELHPVAGRFFTSQEAAVPTVQPVVVLSHGFWRRAYAGDSRVVGQRLRVEGVELTILGVGPAGFAGLESTPIDIWVPIAALAPRVLGPKWESSPGRFAFGLVARLAPGATPAMAASQATAAFRSVVADVPTANSQTTAFTAPLERISDPNGILSEGRVGLWLLGVSTIVLLIAIANVGSLLLTRTVARRREVAVQLALGVSRQRLLGQSLIESAVLCAVAAAAALAVAYVASHVIQQLLLPDFPWSGNVVDLRVLAITLAAATLTALGAGLAPALQAISTDLLGSLRVAPRVSGGRSGVLRTASLALQIALCVVLLVGAGLFVKSLHAVRSHDVGIDLDRVIQAVLPDRPGLPRTEIEALYAQALAKVQGVAGVERAVVSRASTPLGISAAMTVLRDTWTLSDTSGRGMPSLFVVDPDHFSTLGASLERGRGLTAEDVRTGERVAVINRALAIDFFPGEDPLGQCLSLSSMNQPCTRIVGIVENILIYDRTNTHRTQVYVPPTHPETTGQRPRALLIRTQAKAAPIVPIVRTALQSLTPDMPYVPISTLEERAARQLQPWRLGTTMFLLFGGIALLIASVGLFSAMAHAVSQRGHEIGIRLALGASPLGVVLQIGRAGAATVIAGTAAGLLVAAIAAGWLSDLLYQTSPRDPVVFATVAVVLTLAGVAAAVVPTRRATAIDPLVTLKAE